MKVGVGTRRPVLPLLNVLGRKKQTKQSQRFTYHMSWDPTMWAAVHWVLWRHKGDKTGSLPTRVYNLVGRWVNSRRQPQGRKSAINAWRKCRSKCFSQHGEGEASSLLRSGEYPCSLGWLWKNSVDQPFTSLEVDSTSVELCVCMCTHRVRFYSYYKVPGDSNRAYQKTTLWVARL